MFRLSRSYYLPLLRAGVRIYEYTPGFLHAKCWVSDDVTAVVGSINMDYRSLFLHFECGVLLQKNSQVAVLRDDVRATLPQCREIQVTECRTSLPGTVLDSRMTFRREGVPMGLPGFSEFEVWQTSEETIRAARRILNEL